MPKLTDHKIFVLKGTVLSQQAFQGEYRHLVIRAPQIARQAEPGQFVMIQPGRGPEPLLPRPFSIYRAAHAHPESIEILYKVIGMGSALMSDKQPGDDLQVIGPLGHPFAIKKTGAPMWLVGGGYGVGPMVFITDVLRSQKSEVRIQKSGFIRAFIGARTKNAVLCVNEFKKNKVLVHVSTNDGSMGMKGLVTDVIERELKKTGARPTFYACGPTPMLRAVAELAMRYGLPSEVSLEETMGCGTGVCLSCVCDVHSENGGSSQRMICRHGPVFAGDQVQWDKLRKH